MGIVLFSATALFDGLQGVIGWLGSSTQRPTGAAAMSASADSGHHTTPLTSPRVWHRARRAPLRPEAHFGQVSGAVLVEKKAAAAEANPLAYGMSQSTSPAASGLRIASISRAATRVACPARTARPLRVVRVLDSVTSSASSTSASAGRMVISGRMADVCAELDRLAALEAAASPALSLQ